MALRFSSLLLVFFAASLAFAVTPVATVDNDFVQKTFSATCKVEPGLPAVTGDLNGDGVEDVAIPARCTNPVIDQSENNFVVQDPYYTFFGYGDPKITSGFATEDPAQRGVVLLIIHGDGPEAWRSATPKAKFLIINLPYKSIVIRKLGSKKKSVMAIYAEETGGDQMTSALFWDGKKYKYTPLGSSME
jgi:hypothetical protein